MKKILMCILTISLALLMIVPCGLSVSAAATTVKTPFQQWKGGWENHVYGGNTIFNTGCGILSLVNAVYYLTDNFMDVDMVASYAHALDAYNGSHGTGTYRTLFYPSVSRDLGPTYGFAFDTQKWGNVNNSTLKAQLASGYVAVAHVNRHFIALVGYDYKTDRFLVFDSAANPTKRHTTENGDWLSTDFLCNGCVVDGVNYMKIDWWYTIRRTGSATVKPAATPTTYTVKASSNAGGTVHFGNNVTEMKIAAGTVVNYQVTPKSGYKATSIKVGGTAVAIQNGGADTVYKFTMPAGNCNVEVTFSAIAPTTYTVKASSNAGGTVHFGNNVTEMKLAAGTTVYYQVTPKSGYKATSIKVGGTAVAIKNNGADTVYQFTMPAGNCNVEVTFSAITPTTYTVKASSNAGGTVHFGNNVTEMKIAAGTTVYYQVTPKSGYKATSIKVGGTAVAIQNGGADTVYKFTMPAGNCNVEVTFSAITPATYTVKASSNAGGTVHFGNNVTKMKLAAGTTVYYQVTPKSGYKATSIKVGGTAVAIQNGGADTVYIFTMPAAATTVAVTFSKIQVPSATGYVSNLDSFSTTPTSNKALTVSPSKTYAYGVSNDISLVGWSVHQQGVSAFYYTVDNNATLYPLAAQSRADVISAYPQYNQCTAATVGFNGKFNTAALTPGTHTIKVIGKTGAGTNYVVAQVTVKIATPSFTYYNAVDAVGGNAVNAGGSKTIVEALASQKYSAKSGGFNVAGWAVSQNGIKGYRYSFDNSTTFKSLTASYRKDVYLATKGIAPKCTQLNAFSGTISTAGLSKGVHTCTIQGITASGEYFPIAIITITIS